MLEAVKKLLDCLARIEQI